LALASATRFTLSAASETKVGRVAGLFQEAANTVERSAVDVIFNGMSSRRTVA
jgi:hypothetical protein